MDGEEIIEEYELGDRVNALVEGVWRPGIIDDISSYTVLDSETRRRRDVTPENIRGWPRVGHQINYRPNLRQVNTWVPGTIVTINYWVNMQDDNGGIEDVEHLNIRQRVEGPQLPQPAPQLPQGRAYEIHNAFTELNFNKFMDIVRRDNNGASNFKDARYPLEPLITYINNDTSSTFDATEKTGLPIDLNGEIKTRLNMYLSQHPETRDNVMEMTQFVMSQGPDYKDPYIRFLTFDCINAYGSGEASCTKGIFERVFLINKSVLIPLCSDDTSSASASSASSASSTSTCKEVYRELLGCFYPDMDLNALFGEWYDINNMEEGSTSPLANASEEERKDDFRRFVLSKVPRADPTSINNYIDKNENTFKTLLIGGRRKRRNREKTIKRKKTNKKKRTNKRRKTNKRRHK